MTGIAQAVTIVMIEDDEGDARLIEKNVRRAGIHNEIVAFTLGNAALAISWDQIAVVCPVLANPT
jgi:hypothetical protein